MIIGIPTEIKNRENRVAVVPGGVKMLSDAGHKVLIQSNAGLGAGITDEQFESAGASIVADAKSVWSESDMIIKVKEPIADEFPLMREGQIL